MQQLLELYWNVKMAQENAFNKIDFKKIGDDYDVGAPEKKIRDYLMILELSEIFPDWLAIFPRRLFYRRIWKNCVIQIHHHFLKLMMSLAWGLA